MDEKNGTGYSIDQLMELAGLSVACCIEEQYPREQYRRVLCATNTKIDNLLTQSNKHLYNFFFPFSFILEFVVEVAITGETDW